MEDAQKPWWEDHPVLNEIRRRTLEELEAAPGDSEERPPDTPDPVLMEVVSGACRRELSTARDDLERARARYEQAVHQARVAGYSWGEIGRVLGVPRQLPHRRFR